MASGSISYSDWTVKITEASNYLSGTSRGTASKSSPLIPITRVTGNITATVRGGFGWVAAHDDDERPAYMDHLRVELGVTLWLVKENGQKAELIYALGSAGKGGSLQLYDHATTDSFTFNTANITEAQRQTYQYLQLEFDCHTSKSNIGCQRDTDYCNYNSGNPSGSASWTVRDTINVNYDGTEMTNLYFDGTEKGGLYYDEIKIF